MTAPALDVEKTSHPDRAAIIIPARYGSTRYPGKPLVSLTGANGTPRTLIEHSWRAANRVPGVDFVVVATDDMRIAEEARRFGGVAIMTAESCANGTERCAEALAHMADPPAIIVNFQGDAPLMPAYVVSRLIEHLRNDAATAVATPALRCTPSLYHHLNEDERAGRVGGTTVVCDAWSRALYFSKRTLPFLPEHWRGGDECPALLHLGAYAYRPASLADYAAWPPCLLEQAEGLEQLRFLYNGVGIKVVKCDVPDWDVVELNNPSDVPVVEAMLRRSGLD